jgi:hypothetical protein
MLTCPWPVASIHTAMLRKHSFDILTPSKPMQSRRIAPDCMAHLGAVGSPKQERGGASNPKRAQGGVHQLKLTRSGFLMLDSEGYASRLADVAFHFGIAVPGSPG